MPDLTSVTTNLLAQVSETFSNNLSSSILAGAATVPVNSSSPFSNGDIVVLTVEPGTANQATFTGEVSGNSFINCIWTEGNLAANHSSGKTVIDYDSATHYAMLVKAFGIEHEEDGTHGAITPTAISVSGQTWASAITGWLEANATWTYASSTTFTETGDVRTKYPKGCKIRLVQSSTTKYFYVVSTSLASNTTTITVTGGTDYTLANAGITSPYFSYFSTPRGFPQWFAYTPTLTNLTLGNGTSAGKFAVSGTTVTFRFKFTNGSSSAVGTNPSFTLPVAIHADYAPGGSQGVAPLNSAMLIDTGTAEYDANLELTATANTLRFVTAGSVSTSNTAVTATAPHTWASTDILWACGTYEMTAT